MKYASIDIETLGLNPHNCSIIEIAAVLDDLSVRHPLEVLPTFHCYVLPAHGVYLGEPYAMSMHPQILRRIAKREPGYTYLHPNEVAESFEAFLDLHGYGHVDNGPKLNVAGKNYASFDSRFLERLDNWEQFVPTAHRTIDPAILFYREGDEKLPGTELCLERAGIAIDEKATHTAVHDARVVIQLVRAALPKKEVPCF